MPLKQERLAGAVTELEAIIMPDEQGFDPNAARDYAQAGGRRQVFPRQIRSLGTPHLESSLYLRLVREWNYTIWFWPARFPDPAGSGECGIATRGTCHRRSQRRCGTSRPWRGSRPTPSASVTTSY